MTYKSGFKWGIIAGIFFTLFSLGYIILIPAQIETVLISRFIRFDLFLAGLIITVVRTFRRKSVISPTIDAFIFGFGMCKICARGVSNPSEIEELKRRIVELESIVNTMEKSISDLRGKFDKIRFCPSCGMLALSKAEYCGICGKKL